MSDRNNRRRARREAKIPPPSRIAVSLAELGIVGVKEYGVASWCPTPDGSGPAEAVVVHMTIALEFGEMQLGLKLNSADAVDKMIAMLERHRNDVWPGG